jgi:nitroreductase
MNLIEGIQTRKSIRAFKPEPVPKDRLEKILAAARRAPSYTNTQPWEVAVVSGKKRNELARILYELANSEAKTNPDISKPAEWPVELTKRRNEHMAKRSRVFGIDRGNKEQQREFRLANFQFYGAPCIIFLYQDRSLTPYSMLDLGMFAQSVMLAAHHFGLGTCAQASIVDYPDAIRKFLDVPESKRIVLGIALGYPDPTAAVNAYESDRVGIEEFTRWFGFE